VTCHPWLSDGGSIPPASTRISSKFWEILAESQHDKLVLSWLSVVLTVLVIVLSGFVVGVAIRPKPVVVVPGAAVAGVYNAGEMPETVMVQFARNFVADLANYTPASAEKGYLSAGSVHEPRAFKPLRAGSPRAA
jgi:hypothetical protein